MPPLLEAKGLSKRYGPSIALDSVDFQVSEGITGLLVPNGAGKSTAIKPFLGLIRPSAGTAEVMGSRPYESVEIPGRLVGINRSWDATPGRNSGTQLRDATH